MINIKIDGENKKIEINDEEFVLKQDVEKLAMDKMKEILSVTCGYRDDIIENIIKQHFKVDEVKEEVEEKPKGIRKSKFAKFEYNSLHKKLYSITTVTRNGKLNSKSRDFSFNMDQVLFIKKSITDDMTYWDVSKMADKLKLNRDVVGRIIYNLEQGNFDQVITTYQNLQYTKPKAFIENNPQKRREMGITGRL